MLSLLKKIYQKEWRSLFNAKNLFSDNNDANRTQQLCHWISFSILMDISYHSRTLTIFQQIVIYLYQI